MKASYKESMQNVALGESEKTKIRRVLLDATVPVKQHSNILHWKYVVVIAALFLAGAGIYKSVKLSWENEQYGQYEFEIATADYRTPKENVSNVFLQDAKEQASANTDRKAFYEVDSWQSAVNKIGLSMLNSRWFQDNLNNPEPKVDITAECDEEGNVEKIFASALYKASDNEGNDYTVWYTAETQIGAESQGDSLTVGNIGIADTTFMQYTLPYGTKIQIAITKNGGKVRQINTYFVKDNILYHIYADVWAQESGRADIPINDFLAILDEIEECAPIN